MNNDIENAIILYEDPQWIVSIDMSISKITVNKYEVSDEWERHHQFNKPERMITSSGTLLNNEMHKLKDALSSCLVSKQRKYPITDIDGLGRCRVNISCDGKKWEAEWGQLDKKSLKKQLNENPLAKIQSVMNELKSPNKPAIQQGGSSEPLTRPAGL